MITSVTEIIVIPMKEGTVWGQEKLASMQGHLKPVEPPELDSKIAATNVQICLLDPGAP